MSSDNGPASVVAALRRRYELACVDEHDAREEWRSRRGALPEHVRGCRCLGCVPLEDLKQQAWAAFCAQRRETLAAERAWRAAVKLWPTSDGATS